MIDRLREQIQERLDQLVHEADRLRMALAALGPGSSKTPPTKPAARGTATTVPTAPSQSKPTATRRTGTSASRPPRRTASGATKAAVLAALTGGEAMTAGEVAATAGLARATVSTTLYKLAKTGAVQKAERGYRLASAASATPASPPE